MKALIIGGDGLLGSHLVRALLEQGFDVRVLVQPDSRSPTLNGVAAERVTGDLLDGGPGLDRAVRGCDFVFHCAAITNMWADPDLTWKVNLEGTRTVVDACLRNGVKRLVYTGSASSFGFGSLERPGNEQSPFPEAYRGVPYMESKHEAMRLVLKAVERRGLDAVVVAPTFMLGRFDARPSSGEAILQFIRRKSSFVPPGGRNFASASDVAAAMVRALDRGGKGQVYILGGTNLTYLDFFTRVALMAGVPPPRWVLPRATLAGAGLAGSAISAVTGRPVPLNRTMARLATCDAYYSSDKASDALGLERTPVETAIRETLQGLVRYGHLPASTGSYFADKVALVTGGSRGVGYATAEGLVRRGSAVVISARTGRRLADSAQKLKGIGGRVETVQGDVGKWEDARRMVRAAADNFGRLDILVNNAGVSMRGRFEDLAPEVCAQTVETNLMGSVYPTRAAIRHIIEARGHVVFVSSIAGIIGLPGASTYCASKGSLARLCESLRLELIPKRVHCGIVYLGFTEHDPEKRVLAADGSLTPPDRPAHHTQAFAASMVLRLIEERKRQLIMTPIGNLGWVAHRLAPNFVEWAILKAQAGQWSIFKNFS